MARTESVTIPGRFIGPPGSANGGYASGVTASLLGDDPVEVTLHAPPPVDRPLRVLRSDDGALALYDGDVRVTTGRPGTITEEVPAGVSFDEATRAATTFDLTSYRSVHPFPTCFTCGPAREPGDGLRIFPAFVDGQEGFVVWPWVPPATTGADDGLVDTPVLWAALDCPSGMARFSSDEGTRVDSVLGQMTTTVHRRPTPGDNLVVTAWIDAEQGRRTFAGSALWSADGELLAQSRTVWVALTSEQMAAFSFAQTDR